MRFLGIIVFILCTGVQAFGQLTARKADGKVATSYFYNDGRRDTIFVFNQTPEPKKGNLSLEYRPNSMIDWTKKDPETSNYEPHKKYENVIGCTENLEAGEYRITVSNPYVPPKIIDCKVDTVKNENGTYTVTITSDILPKPVTQVKTDPMGRFTVTVDLIECIFDWYLFDYTTKNFVLFKTEQAYRTSDDNLEQGGYKVTVTPVGESTPCIAFVAWLYMNPGFNFKLRKGDNGEVLKTNRTCMFTNFPFEKDTPTVQSTFGYYNPDRLENTWTLVNTITFSMKRGNDEAIVVSLNTQGDLQYLRDNNPPHEDTRYEFRAYDRFGIEKKDDIMYKTILPYVTLNKPELPDVDPASAPVLVKLKCEPNNITQNNDIYVWRFGNGDSIVYDADHQPLDIVEYTYYTPKKSGYQLELSVTSLWGCTYTTPQETISVDDPKLDVANVFTPNGDTMNDYFKPYIVSLRQFEITIYTRTGRRVYHYKGNDLRSWEGWDGRIENSGKEAAEGVYFYEIKALGWDEPPTRFNHKSQKQTPPQVFGGTVHLYR